MSCIAFLAVRRPSSLSPMAPAVAPWSRYSSSVHSYDWIFSSRLYSTFAPFPFELPRWVSICPDGVSFSPETTPNPCSLLRRHTPFGDMYVHKTPLFLAWTWKWAKRTTIWAIWTPTGQTVWKVGKFVLFIPFLLLSSSDIEDNKDGELATMCSFLLQQPRAIPSSRWM